MQPNSLVFVVIVGIWAAFFVQHWVRRREHALTAHTVDRLSEAMRVLDGSERSAVKVSAHALAEAGGPRPSILTQRPAHPLDSLAASAPAAAADRAAVARSAPAEVAAAVARPAAAEHSAAGTGQRAPRPARQVRGVTFLASLLATMVTLLLAPFGLVGWPVVAGSAIAAGLSLVWLRSCVRAEQRIEAARREARAARRRAAAAVESAPAGVRSARPQPAAGRARPAASSATASAETGAPEQPAAVARVDRVADPDGLAAEEFVAVEVVPATQPEVMAPLVDEDDIPLTWEPVPVPRPTYTMKVKAAAPATSPSAPVEPAAAESATEGEHTAYEPGQRRAVGS